MFESIKTVGQYIHTTHRPMGPGGILPGELECNVAVTPTSYSVLPHLRPNKPEFDADGDPTLDPYLHGGDVIQLYHKEISAYLAAEGVFFENQPREDVHLRVREPDTRRPHRLLPPTSAVSYWQVEIDDAPTSGAVVQWEQQIRLRHITTQLYLVLERGGDGFSTGYRIALSNNNSDASGVFMMTAVIREESQIQKNSYTRIQHVATGTEGEGWGRGERDMLHASAYLCRWSLNKGAPGPSFFSCLFPSSLTPVPFPRPPTHSPFPPYPPPPTLKANGCTRPRTTTTSADGSCRCRTRTSTTA